MAFCRNRGLETYWRPLKAATRARTPVMSSARTGSPREPGTPETVSIICCNTQAMRRLSAAVRMEESAAREKHSLFPS